MRRWLRRRRLGDQTWRMLGRAGWAVLGLVLLSAAGQLFMGRSWGLVPTSGEAMAPTIRGGGMLLCLPYGFAEPDVGQIVVLRPRELDHDLVRRVVGRTADGWLTQGDGLEATDQELGLWPVSRAEIHGFVPQIGSWPLWLPGLGALGARPGSRGRLLVALAAALILVALPPAKAAGKRLSRRRRRAMATSRVWLYTVAAMICVVLTGTATAWVGGRADVKLASTETALAESTADGPVDIAISPAAGRVVVSNESPLALLVLAYPQPEGQSLVDRRFAVVPARGSQAFGLTQGVGAADSGIKLAYAPAVVPGDWLYPLAREWGPLWGFMALSAMQFGLAAAVLCGFDLTLAALRR